MRDGIFGARLDRVTGISVSRHDPCGQVERGLVDPLSESAVLRNDIDSETPQHNAPCFSARPRCRLPDPNALRRFHHAWGSTFGASRRPTITTRLPVALLRMSLHLQAVRCLS